MKKIKVAVTGAAGQVGSVLVRRMNHVPEFDVVAQCRNQMSAGIIDSVAHGCEIRIGSITDQASSRRLLGDCDVVINCALAMISGKPKLSRQLNRDIIDNFAHLANLKAVVHMSSISVYRGCIDNKKCPKSSFEQPLPDNDYGRSKLFIEQYANKMCKARGLKYYLLRLGHVIGAKMDRSREILEFARNPAFRLPFNGMLPSNVIHVERLATSVIALLTMNSVKSGVYNVAEKKDWRQIFDWHTQAVGLPAVSAMSKYRSKSLRSYYRSQSIVKDIVRWLKSLPFLSLVRYPAVFELAYRLISIAPPDLTMRLSTIYKRMDVKNQIKSTGQGDSLMLSPVYFSEAMPGIYLDLNAGQVPDRPSDEQLARDLEKWYQQFALPCWLPDLISQGLVK